MNASAALVALSSVLLAVSIWHFGRRHPGYRHAVHTISELGEAGAANSRLVSLGVFLPFGLCMMLVHWLNHFRNPEAASLAACVGVGYLAAAIFPCDPGAPLMGSWRQHLHNLGGAVQYVGGAATLWRMSLTSRGFALLAVVVSAAVVLLSTYRPGRGAAQRVAEVALLAALVLATGTRHAV